MIGWSVTHQSKINFMEEKRMVKDFLNSSVVKFLFNFFLFKTKKKRLYILELYVFKEVKLWYDNINYHLYREE